MHGDPVAHGDPMAEVAATLRRILSTIDAGDVLEVGCGDGDFTELLCELLASYRRIDALDTDDDAVAEARAYFARAHPGAPVTFRVGTAAGLPYADESVDTAVLSDTLHHLATPQEALSEVVRVLRPSGRVLVNEMVSDIADPRRAVGRDLHHLKARIDRSLGISHNDTFSRAELASLCAGAGLQELVREEYDPTAPEQDDIDLDEKLEQLDAYADHAAAEPDYPGIRREVSRLKQRVRAVGFAPAPQVLAVYGKRAAVIPTAAADGGGRS